MDFELFSSEEFSSECCSLSSATVTFDPRRTQAQDVSLDDDITYTDNSCNSSDQNDTIVTKLPRIIKRDLRPSYVNMLANVLNTSDMSLAESFFSTFSLPNLTFAQSDETRGFNSFQLNGQISLLQFWFNRIHFIPDAVWQFSEAYVESCALDPLCSEVSCNFTYNGSLIYDLPFSSVLPTAEQITNTMEKQKRPKSKRKIAPSVSSVNRFGGNLFKNPSLPSSASALGVIRPVLLSTGNNIGSRNKQTASAAVKERLIPTDFSNAHLYDTTILTAIENAAIRVDPIAVNVSGQVTFFLDANKALTKLVFHNGRKFREQTVETVLLEMYD